MFATKDITEVINGHFCCECEKEPACEYCPYFDEMDPADCTYRLNNDIQYYLKQTERQLRPTEEEQPYLPGLEQEFDLSKVKFMPGDYICLKGVKYVYGVDLEEGIRNGENAE